MRRLDDLRLAGGTAGSADTAASGTLAD